MCGIIKIFFMRFKKSVLLTFLRSSDIITSVNYVKWEMIF
jgi:hypothetical protein